MIKLLLSIFAIIFWLFLTLFLLDFYNNYVLRLENVEIVKKLEKNTNIKDLEFLEIPKYYINLKRSKERDQKINNQFKKYRIQNYHRVEAFDVKKLDSYDYINQYTSFFAGNYVELAVTLSHIKAINTAYLNLKNQTYQYALIMEDDVNFCTVPYWDIKLKNLIEEIEKNYQDCDILLLANNSFKKGKLEILKAKESYGIATGVCYLVTIKGMKKLHNNFIKDDKIQLLKKHRLGQQPFVFDRGFLNYFDLYYTSQSLFIPEDFQQETLVQKNLINQSKISNKIINYYKELIK